MRKKGIHRSIIDYSYLHARAYREAEEACIKKKALVLLSPANKMPWLFLSSAVHDELI
jgi:hypothetical protein